MKTHPAFLRRRGLSMLMVLFVLAAISALALVATGLSRANIQMSGHYRWSEASYADAVAATEYVKSRIEADLVSGLITLTNAVENVNYTAPDGFHFEPVTRLTRLADPRYYLFTVIGHSGPSRTVMEGVLRRRHLLFDLGLFGDKLLKIQPGTGIYGYRSHENPYPASPAESLGGVGVGSNERFHIQVNGVVIDGVIYGGQDTQGYSPSPPPDSFDYDDLGERIIPDPLGIRGGVYEEYVNFYSRPGNNDNRAVSAINGNNLVVKKETVALPPGNYYLKDLEVRETLVIMGTFDDPVVLWMDGPMKVWPAGQVITPSGRPSLHIFQHAYEDIDIQPNQKDNEHLMAYVYAPYSDVKILPNNDSYGTAWGMNLELQPNINYYVDLDILDQLMSHATRIVSRKEIRETYTP